VARWRVDMGVDGVAGVACGVSENQFGEVEKHS